MMSSTEFTGHVSAMRADNEFLGAEDLVGRGDTPVQIAKCNRCLKRKACGKMVDEMYTLNLTVNGKPAKKELWIKATNRQQISKLYGPNVAEWKGKWLWLYVTEVKSPQGGTTLGIRIRDKKDAPTSQQQQHATPKPDPTDLNQHHETYHGIDRRIATISSGADAQQLTDEIRDEVERGNLTTDEAAELNEHIRRVMT